ncbi:MAG: c-type cytochrome [Bacteroidota bacterium]
MNRHLILALLVLCTLQYCTTDSDQAQSEEESPQEITYNMPDGFELEILFEPKANNRGSWVSMAEGPDNTLFASDQWGDLYQFKTPEKGTTLDTFQIQKVDLEIGFAHGLLWAFDGLYVSVNKRWPEEEDSEEFGSGIYKLTDSDGDGQLDQRTMLMKLDGEGEHGPHSLRLSPDGKEIYFIAGNHTMIPEEVADNSRLPNNWGEDNLFEPYLDARGHANHIKAPGGWIAKFDPSGENWELISAGFRNPFDFGFNKDGELFAFDSDMEWDMGMPWYRPIRVCHVTSGAEFGWRTGSGKWPDYYVDNLPAVVNLGQGSPTAVVMANELSFPGKYSNGMFVFDWSFGTVYHIDLHENGSTYKGVTSEFFSGTPLPLTDAIAGSDGSLYFATGGRNLESKVYRLSHVGEDNAQGETKLTSNNDAAEIRALRNKIESYHNQNYSPQGADLMWENLNHTDRFVRYAARLGLEHYVPKIWSGRLLVEKDKDRIIQGAVLTARAGQVRHVKDAYNKLLEIDWTTLDRNQRLDYLRAISLNSIRHELPNTAQKEAFIKKMSSSFPSQDYALDRELSQVLLKLGDDSATTKTIALLNKHTKEKTITHPSMLSQEVSERSQQYGPTIMKMTENMPSTEAIYYATLLSHIDQGWKKEDQESYFNWFYDGLNASGGLSFKPFLENIRVQAMSHIPKEEKSYYEELSGVYQPGAELANLPQPEGPGKDYHAREVLDILRDLRDYKGDIEDGKLIYEAAFCASCHRMNGEGGNAGPDLTQLHTRFNSYSMVFAVYSPNDEISDQYANTMFELKDGKKTSGKLISEEGDNYVIQPSPYSTNYTVEIAKSDVVSKGPSPISPMPVNLLSRLNEKEILDLFAYLNSGGDPEHAYYGGE